MAQPHIPVAGGTVATAAADGMVAGWVCPLVNHVHLAGWSFVHAAPATADGLLPHPSWGALLQFGHFNNTAGAAAAAVNPGADHTHT